MPKSKRGAPAKPSTWKTFCSAGPASESDYQRVRVSGTFVPGKERFYYAPHQRLGPGYDIYQPLKYTPHKVVWVNRGYIPERERNNPKSWQAPEAELKVTGVARLPAVPGSFTPDNDLKGNVWYWRDLAGMQNSAFAGAESIGTAPLFIVAEPEKTLSDVEKAHVSGDGPWPQRGVSNIVCSQPASGIRVDVVRAGVDAGGRLCGFCLVTIEAVKSASCCR